MGRTVLSIEWAREGCILAEHCKNARQPPAFEVIYKVLHDLHCKNKNNWVSHVCFTLYRYGFGFVWENQGVYNTKRFVCEFRQRLIDGYLQEWHSDVTSRDRLVFYSSFIVIPLQNICLS